MDSPPLGNLELDILRFITDRAPATVGQVAAGYGEPNGLSRSTVVTVMERLRQKGYLSRHRRGGVFSYAPQAPSSEVLLGVVRRFVQKTLGGSVSPVVAYLANEPSLTDEDLRELERVVEELKAHRRETAP